jgi:hypothetical protein
MRKRPHKPATKEENEIGAISATQKRRIRRQIVSWIAIKSSAANTGSYSRSSIKFAVSSLFA